MLSSTRINRTLLIIIISLSAVLRFYNYSCFSITADEVSAINRAQFSSFSELIDKGVCADTHPAGVQVFLFFWIKVFGTSEAAVRFPFIVAGILSVLLTYLIAKKWFNETVALLSAAALGFLEYPITYSQLARPYSPGLLFSLLAVWFWTKFLFDKKHKNRFIVYGFVVSVSLAMYTHYISALFVVIVSVTGLFFISKENYKSYLLAGLCVVLLYIPHAKIFFIQLGKGGVGGPDGWLGTPTPEFLLEYVRYGFNDSVLILVLCLTVFLVGIILSPAKFQWKRFHTLCVMWFFIPYAVTYFYSVHINPLLQYSVLLFSFPFLIIFLFSFLPEFSKSIWKIIMISIFSFFAIYSTVYEKQFFNSQRFGVLKEIADDIMKYDEKFGEENITHTINLVGPYSIHYYFSQQNKKPVFKSYMNNGHKELSEFSEIIDSASTSHFVYAWSTRHSPPEITEMILEKYPVLTEKKWYYNSEFYLFSKQGISIDTTFYFFSKNDFENAYQYWSVNEKQITDSVKWNGKKGIKLDSLSEYGPTFRCKVRDIISSVNDVLHISTGGKITTRDSDAQLVISFEKKGKSYDWHSNNFSFFLKNPGEWEKVFLSVRMPEQISPEDDVIIYVWNNAKKTIFIDDMQVKVGKGNPLAYGKRKEFIK